jgi:hypothetical protein
MDYSKKYKIKKDIQTHLGKLYKGDIIYIQNDENKDTIMVTDMTGRIFWIPGEFIDYSENSDLK